MKLSVGFTLIEVQMALVILVLIVTVSMGGLQLTDKASKAVTKLSDKNMDVRTVSDLLENQLSSILPLSTVDKSKKELAFEGESYSLYYMGYLPEHAVEGQPWLIHLYSDKKQLLLDYKAFDHRYSFDKNKKSGFRSIVLLDNLGDFSLEYLSTSNGIRKWEKKWKSKDAMPGAIKVMLKQSTQVWPKLIVPIYSFNSIDVPVHLIAIE